jgi:hypothetical protein
LDDKSSELIDLRLSLENPYQTSSLKESITATEIFTSRLKIYEEDVDRLKSTPQQLFGYLEGKKTEIVKKLRGGERSGSKDDN